MIPFSSLRTAVLCALLAAAPFAACAEDAPAVTMPAEVVLAEVVAPPAELPALSPVTEEPLPAASIPEMSAPAIVREEPRPAPVLSEPEVLVSKASEVDVLPHMAMLSDATAKLDAAGAHARLAEARPYVMDLFQREAGAVWFHLALDKTGDSAPHTLWLDLAMQTPYGTSVLLSKDGRGWKEVRPDMPGLYPLREAGRHGEVLIRMNGLPGFWFHPVLRSLDTAMHSPERPLLLTALTVMILLGVLNLLSSLTHRGESRFWFFVLAAAASVQALWGIPAVASGIFGTFPGVFAAGVALFALPHAGRVLMHTERHSPSTDMLFLLFALPGACAAVVPLIPALGWTGRLLIFWPLASLLCILPSLVLVFRGIAGSGPFLLSCMAMGGGAMVSLWGLTQGVAAPLWGLSV
ncbi:MAG: hypothetical protein IIV56_06295, partial [Mailhella sp.]|nr:hypothetical protein [Mailhella sp.]